MRESEYRALLAKRQLSPDVIAAAVRTAEDLERFAHDNAQTVEDLPLEMLEDYISALILTGQNAVERLVAITRYLHLVENFPAYLHMLGLIGGREVLPSIAERTAELAGEAARDAIFADLPIPPAGSPQEAYPETIAAMLDRFSAHVDGDATKRILAGNHHRVPREFFLKYRQTYLDHGIDAALAERHADLLAQLTEHVGTGKPWYEQVITPQVLEHVRANPEIQAGVRDGEWIYVSKIPYMSPEFFSATDPTMRRYYQCHCTLARASIIDRSPEVDPLFCYCSAGYEKLAFDVIFDQPVEVEILETALAGDERCRFRIRIPAGGAQS